MMDSLSLCFAILYDAGIPEGNRFASPWGSAYADDIEVNAWGCPGIDAMVDGWVGVNIEPGVAEGSPNPGVEVAIELGKPVPSPDAGVGNPGVAPDSPNPVVSPAFGTPS